jgi:hypothetical protein
MRLLDALVEQRIAAVIERGEFDDLPAAGAMPDERDAGPVPAALSMASRIVKIAGFVPPAMEQLRALCELHEETDALGACVAGRLDEAKLLALGMALESLRGDPFVVPREYRRRMAERLSARLTTGPVGGADE